MSPRQHHGDSSCREKLNEIISSVADMEVALADAINAQTRILRKENLNSEQLALFTMHLEQLIVLTIKKEMMLEFLIQDVVAACQQLSSQDNKR